MCELIVPFFLCHIYIKLFGIFHYFRLLAHLNSSVLIVYVLVTVLSLKYLTCDFIHTNDTMC